MGKKHQLLHEELSGEVIGCAFAAFKTVGVGFSELHYHKFFHDNLIKQGLNAKYKVPWHLDYHAKRIADYEIDDIVEDKLIVELKEIQTNFIPENYAQVITYLKLTKLRLGLLINFNFENLQLNPFEIDHWLIEDRFLLGVFAGKDEPRAYDLLRTRSYLKHLNLRHALVAHWSMTNLQLFGIHQT
jgi:GxxExxY protein